MVTRRRQNKWLWGLTVFIVLMMVVAIAVVLLINNKTKEGDGANNKQGTTIEEQGKDKKETGRQPEEAQQKQDVLQYDGESPNAAESLTGVVAYTGVNGGNLVIRTNIDQFLDEGTCTLILSRNGTDIYSEEAVIESLVSTAVCDGYEIPIYKLGVGEIGIEIVLKSGEKYGKIVGEAKI